jgi:hypothetical protein
VEAAREKADAAGVTVLPKPYRIKALETALEEARATAHTGPLSRPSQSDAIAT